MEAFANAFGTVSVFAVIFGTVLGFRYMKHRETVKMIEHGYTPEMLRAQERGITPPDPRMMPMPVPHRTPQGRAQLVWGCVLAGIGLALTLALWPLGFVINGTAGLAFPLGIGPWMVAGFIPLFVGLALILTYILVHPRYDGSSYAVPPTMPSDPPPSYRPDAFASREAMSFTVRPPESREG